MVREEISWNYVAKLSSREGFKAKNMRGKQYIRFSKDWTEGELEALLKQSPFRILRTFTTPH